MNDREQAVAALLLREWFKLSERIVAESQGAGDGRHLQGGQTFRDLLRLRALTGTFIGGR